MTALQLSSAVDAGSGRLPAPKRGVLRALLRSKKALVGAVILLVFAVVALAPSWFTSIDDPNAPIFIPLAPPGGEHWLGTTSLGQDVWAQLVYGTRQSMIIAVVAGSLTTLLAVAIGVTAGYLGGVVDDVLRLLINCFLVMPTFPLIVVLAGYAGKSSLTVVILVLVVTSWSYGANQLRAQAMALRSREFLEAARLRGERRSYIILFEVLPSMTSLTVANFLGAALYSVLTAAGLQFLGLGDPSTSSWGTMLYWAKNQQALHTGAPLWAIAPGLCVALLGVSFAFLNYGFDELSNPALRPVRRRRAR